MKNKRLSLQKTTITRLNNLHSVKGGNFPSEFDTTPIGTAPSERPTTKTAEGDDFTENGTLTVPGLY